MTRSPDLSSPFQTSSLDVRQGCEADNKLTLDIIQIILSLPFQGPHSLGPRPLKDPKIRSLEA